MPREDNYAADNLDPYLEANSQILKNIPGISDEAILSEFEYKMTTSRALEINRIIKNQMINLELWQLIHRWLFRDVYDWAGEIRSIRMSKGNTLFAYPEYIKPEAAKIFKRLKTDNYLTNLGKDAFADKLSYYYCELNIIHPFREGNGRTQKLLFSEITTRAGHELDWSKIGVDEYLTALTHSVNHDHKLMATLFAEAII